jgi:hypothetical protein
VPVEIDIEWMRAFLDLQTAGGGSTGSSSGASSLVEILPLLFGSPQSSPEAQDALRAVEELRQELVSLRALFDLRSRVETIEDRLL